MLGQLGGRWLLKRGPGGPDGGAPGQSTLLQDPRPPALAKTVSPEPPSRPSISGFSFIFGQVPALLRACSAVSVAHTRGDTDETEEAEWAVGRLCRLPQSRRVTAAASMPCLQRGLRGCGVVSVSMTQSPCLRHGPCGIGVVSVSVAWSPWLWHTLRGRSMVSVSTAWLCAHGVVSVAAAWSPWLCCDLRAHGVVSVSVACSPWLQRGLHVHDVVPVSATCSLWLQPGLRVHGVVSMSMPCSPCPSHALCGVLSMSVVCSPCLWSGLCFYGVVSMSVAWSPCLWHGLCVHGVVVCPWRVLRVHGMVSVSVAWSPCPWRGGLSMAWSPCLWHGLHVSSMVSMAAVWSLWLCLAYAASPLVYLPPTCQWMFSLVKIGLQSKSSHMASGTDIDCTDLTPYGKFLEVTSWARGVHVLDSFDSHSPTTLQRGHTLSCFSLSVYLRAVCPQGVHRADPWGTKG